MAPIYLYDTTLRDGTQGENITFSADEKVKIALKLDDIGVHYIEGGWPGSNPKDMQFFDLAKRVKFKNARLAAFGSTRKPGIEPAEDENLMALLTSETPTVTIFGKSWNLHVEEVMSNTLEENIAMIRDSVKFLKWNGREVIYDAEHFFDGYKANPAYALKTLSAAAVNGAHAVVLCDTNGGTMPEEIAEIRAEADSVLAQLQGGADFQQMAVAVSDGQQALEGLAGAVLAEGDRVLERRFLPCTRRHDQGVYRKRIVCLVS